MKMFIMGGTAESIEIIKHIKTEHPEIYTITSTTTEYGANIAREAGSDEVIAKPLPKDDILEVLDKNNVDLYVDATHPFAKHVTQTACDIVDKTGIAFIRFERESIVDSIEVENPGNIYHVNSFTDAGLLVEEKFPEGNVLHLGGINTAGEVLENVSRERFYIRVLTVKASLDKCQELGIMEDHIFPMNASKNKDKKIHIDENMDLFDKVDAKVMLTKESGDIGGFREKMVAADKKKLKIIIVDRPVIEGLKDKKVVNTIEEFDEEVNKYLD